ncbi:MAG: pitrilysin family protein [candidate division Zixibacteria bacterium]
MKSERVETYKRTVLPNGLRIITESIPYVRSVSLGLWLDVGSRDEPLSSLGISHFIEHMVFKGTRTRSPSEIASHLESVGGVLNAFTGREQTCFYAKFLDEHLDKGVEILFDLINNPLFGSSDIEKEKKVILEEIRDIEDAPGELVHDLFAEAIFSDHPLGRPILGNKKTVMGLNRGKVLRFVGKHYRPANIIVAASGNLEHNRLVKITKKYADRNNNSPVSPNNRKKPKFKALRQVFRRNTNQTHICLGLPTKEFTNESRGAMLLLNSILGGGMSSRLFQHLREELGLVYTVFSFLDFFADNGIFGIYLGTEKTNAGRALGAIRHEIDRITENRLTDLELASAKEQLKGNLMLGLENTSNRMNRLAKHELLANRHITLDETVAGIDAVTADDVLKVAREVFLSNQFSAVTLGPVKGNIYAALE